MSNKWLLGCGQQCDDTLLDRILVLLQPSSDGVVHCTSIMLQLKVSLSTLDWLGFAEVWRFAQMVRVQLLLEGLIGSLGNDTLLFQNGHDTKRLHKENQSCYINTKLHINFNRSYPPKIRKRTTPIKNTEIMILFSQCTGGHASSRYLTS